MKKLLLIDGNAILHRAYHALPPLTNSRAETVNAVYGFFSMLLNVLIDQKPEYLVICFDRPGPNFRQALFAGYQQHRPQLADDFVPQIILVHELLTKMKTSVFELDGYEADDLIGTISYKTVKDTKDVEVIVLTGDRDMLQLVNHRVKILMPLIGITKTALFGEQEVEEKYGVKPSQFIDYKALIGDASDGYPGVAGIGPKTASNLLQKFDNFENLYKHLDEVPEKISLKLATDAEQAALAKKLATIATDAPIQFKVADCTIKKFDKEGIIKAFHEQGFKSLTARYESFLGIPPSQPAPETKEKSPKKSTGQLGFLD